MSSRIATALFLATAIFSFSGCGSEGNTVVQPTEDYQLTETEAANAEREDQEREAEAGGEARR